MRSFKVDSCKKVLLGGHLAFIRVFVYALSIIVLSE